MEKVLISGGAGFIGRRLATHLTDHEQAVTGHGVLPAPPGRAIL